MLCDASMRAFNMGISSSRVDGCAGGVVMYLGRWNRKRGETRGVADAMVYSGEKRRGMASTGRFNITRFIYQRALAYNSSILLSFDRHRQQCECVGVRTSTVVRARHVAPVVHGRAVRRGAARRLRRVRRHRARRAGPPRRHRAQARRRRHVLHRAGAQRAHGGGVAGRSRAGRSGWSRASRGHVTGAPARPHPAPPAPSTYTQHTRITTFAHITGPTLEFRSVFTPRQQHSCISYECLHTSYEIYIERCPY